MRQAVVLMNLGTPARADISAVRAFLRQFLSDPRVVELPRLIWLPLLYGVILPFRPRKALHAYSEIWTPEGSPLKVITLEQVEKLQQLYRQRCPDDDVIVTHAMTYGEPSLPTVMNELTRQGVTRIILLPLYPQYSATTTAPIYDQLADWTRAQRNIPEIFVHRCYYDRRDYIAALARSIEEHWQNKGRQERLLFSFHGIPQRCVDRGDPYYDHCVATATSVAGLLGLQPEQWALSFQSRLGKAQWLQPYTDKFLANWAENGVASVDVICPAFSADCVETLEEIMGENKEVFLEHGGKTFEYIPCLNSRDDHIQMFFDITQPLLKSASTVFTPV